MSFPISPSRRPGPLRWLPTLLLCLLPAAGQAKETLNWLMRDLPPSTIFTGPLRGQGAIDRLMPLLIARMPEYNHALIRVNRARSTQMLTEHPFSCDPTIMWTAERARNIAFSIPVYMLYSSGLVIRKTDMPRFTAFIVDGRVDLRRALDGAGLKVGVVAQRSYGPAVDRIIKDASDEAVTLHYGAEAVGSLLQMERLGRLQALLGFWPEVRYQATQENLDPEELMFLPIQGNPPYQYAHVGCSDTPQGRQAILIINKAMRELRTPALSGFYAQWLAPAERDGYLRDAKAYFDRH